MSVWSETTPTPFLGFLFFSIEICLDESLFQHPSSDAVINHDDPKTVRCK